MQAKCVVWDLDNTLWHGILSEGEVKIKENIIDILKTLDSRGILLSIASKNNYEDAMEKLKEFKIEHLFLYPQINWNSKSVSIAEIQKKLNIGMDTIIFIDDQEFERDEVHTAHTEVLCIDSQEYNNLLNLEIVNPKVITMDTKRRREMYIEDNKRKVDEENFSGAPEQFLKGLNLKFTIKIAEEEDLLRAEELTYRTHQLNSTGIQYSYDELKAMMELNEYDLWICELEDKYGSYGKIGLALVEKHDSNWTIKLLLMSCRTISRGAGSILLNFIMKEAKRQNKNVFAELKQTDRNRIMYVTYKFANFIEVERREDYVLLKNDLSVLREYPDYVQVIYNK